MRIRYVAWIFIAAGTVANTACEGIVRTGEATASSPGAGESEGSGSAHEADAGLQDDDGGQELADDAGAGSAEAGSTASTCESSGKTQTRDPDGGCGQASNFGVCGSDILEVDCICPDNQGLCFCMKNGKQVGTVGYDCTTCAGAGVPWTSCGFP
jgi:hypothetical protein